MFTISYNIYKIFFYPGPTNRAENLNTNTAYNSNAVPQRNVFWFWKMKESCDKNRISGKKLKNKAMQKVERTASPRSCMAHFIGGQPPHKVV